MSCVFRASGVNFDVDRFVSIHAISPDRLWRRGEPQSSGELLERSGFIFIASEANPGEFDQQVDDVALFIGRHGSWLESLIAHPGVEFPHFDFAVTLSNATIPGFYFPEAFVKEAGRIGLGLQISVY